MGLGGWLLRTLSAFGLITGLWSWGIVAAFRDGRFADQNSWLVMLVFILFHGVLFSMSFGVVDFLVGVRSTEDKRRIKAAILLLLGYAVLLYFFPIATDFP